MTPGSNAPVGRSSETEALVERVEMSKRSAGPESTVVESNRPGNAIVHDAGLPGDQRLIHVQEWEQEAESPFLG
jgi:hypothetical protein